MNQVHPYPTLELNVLSHNHKILKLAEVATQPYQVCQENLLLRKQVQLLVEQNYYSLGYSQMFFQEILQFLPQRNQLANSLRVWVRLSDILNICCTNLRQHFHISLLVPTSFTFIVSHILSWCININSTFGR